MISVCYQCLLNGADSIALGSSHALGEVILRTISPDLLIAPDFQRFSIDQVLKDGVLDLYLHRPAGPVEVNGGGYGVQTIQALAIDDAFVLFFENILRKLDAELDLDFRLTASADEADVRLNSDSEISLGGEGVTLGIALGNETPDKSFWELMLNTPAFYGDIDYLYYAALHELGHALGLEHPFDASDGDVFENSNPGSNAYPEETLMAYREPLGENWPNWFTENDIAALKQIWGQEINPASTFLPQQLIGTSLDDELIGGSGSDLLRGEFGNDILIGGDGSDELWGGPSSNRFLSPEDDSTDWVLITRDGSNNIQRNRRSVDEIAELGVEDYVGIIGVQTNQLRFSSTAISSVAYGQLKGIGIFVGKRLEAVYTGGDLSLMTLRDLTVGLPANYTGDLG